MKTTKRPKAAKRPKKNKRPLTLNLESAAREFAVSRETLRRNLVDAGQKIGPGEIYTIATLYNALAGSWRAKRARLAAARADVAEHHRDKIIGSGGEQIPRADIEALLKKFSYLFSGTVRPLSIAVALRLLPNDADACAVIEVALLEWLSNLGAAAVSTFDLPSWVAEAFVKSCSSRLKTFPEDDQRRIGLFGDLLAAASSVAMEEVLAKAMATSGKN